MIGLMLSALLHYLYRNTYIDYERVKGMKVWTKKFPLKRKHILVMYGANIVPLVNLAVLIFLFMDFCINQDEYGFHFEVKNKFTEWLDKEV